MAQQYRAVDYLFDNEGRLTRVQQRIMASVTNGLGYDAVPHGKSADEQRNLQDHLHMLDQNTYQSDFAARLTQLIHLSEQEDDYLTMERKRERHREIRRLHYLINPQDR